VGVGSVEDDALRAEIASRPRLRSRPVRRSRIGEIMPGESKEYLFEIPANHPPGLDWYHPHHHGSTAVQAGTGMAGGIITYGAIDEVPQIKVAKDYPLVMQDIGLFPSEDDPTIWTYLSKQNAIWQTFTSDVTI
jgi:suppressor of ftsI